MLIHWCKKKIISSNKYILEKAKKQVKKINSMESVLEKLSDIQLIKQTEKFKLLIKNGNSLESILPEAFATVREASKRVFGMRHFDVQLLGGIILHYNCIAEMKTGEGKTLTSTLPVYLNSLSGKGVHVVTMNDYLSARDVKTNKPLFEFLGLTVGLNLSNISSNSKRKAYFSDITYGTNNEFGFDYLRDNMVLSKKNFVQRKLNYALIDEVDSILIDEARTPLVISGDIENKSDLYLKINNIIFDLVQKIKKKCKKKYYFVIDEKQKQIYLTEKGLNIIEKLLLDKKLLKKNESLYSLNNIILLYHSILSLRAHILFFKNIDYIINEKKEILIIDEHTGRSMVGRKWSDGLHQAIEAKERVKIHNESQTLATTTFQNYFRLYSKLSGMTGTAVTESFEFKSIYNLDTVKIPTNKPMIRKDLTDLVYLTEKDKIAAIIQDIQYRIKKKQPVLVGTISIANSEIISQKLSSIGIKHNVLNAKFHSQEAKIISDAGKPGSVTIATNMAGRGTDIVLGGSFSKYKSIQNNCNTDVNSLYLKKKWEKNNNLVISSGGLHIIGTERHESRRIDNQLRGRSGRQGDPGSSRFYLSLDDSLMRIFAPNGIKSILKKFGMKNKDSIEHPWVNNVIENAQRSVENRNFEIRKQLLEYDDVIDKQRFVIYQQRKFLLYNKNISYVIKNIAKDVFEYNIQKYTNKKYNKNYNIIRYIQRRFEIDFNIKINIVYVNSANKKNFEKKIIDLIYNIFIKSYCIKRRKIGKKFMEKIEKSIMINKLDFFWRDHLDSMDYLRQGIHLRCYAQKNPKQEYQNESFKMFISMITCLKNEFIKKLCFFIFKNEY
ncbi:preprotein translocase subunit SecA [Buchnera aphidicola (Kurisakia onigurumii)]|uniref:preprotein translocase subunit SecA n=1 Tax=Buchnera aphidicola TaxID=9 RepID=UPI0031B6A26D